MHIGQKIQQVLREKKVNVTWLAEQMPCDRSNIYNIFRREDISTEVLRRMSVLVGYDFFAYLSDELKDDIAKADISKVKGRR